MKFKDVIAQNTAAIARLSKADMSKLLPVLHEARDATASGLFNWLKKADREGKFTDVTHRQMVVSLDESIKIMKRRMFPSLHADLQREAREAGSKALITMKKAAEAGAKKFADSAAPLRIDNARILLDQQRSLLHRHASSAQRYGIRRGNEIRRQIAVGLIRGESTEATISRLMGMPQLRTKRMSDSQAADEMADNQLFKNRADAERLIRTENIHAANAAQEEALRTENESGDGEGGWMMRWDATFDLRTCADCARLHGMIRAPGETFDGVDHPPLHPNCRCAIVPWRVGWTL